MTVVRADSTRDIVRQIYTFGILHGEKVANPALEVGPSSIATFAARDQRF